MIFIAPHLLPYFPANMQSFKAMMQQDGMIYRELAGRCTKRISLNNEPYFLKQHFGVGWWEIIKNLLQGRLPIISAKNEWRAILRLQELGVLVPTVAAYGSYGVNPATKQSFLLTKELANVISLEDYCRNWRIKAPDFSKKYQLLQKVAHIARTLHANGINHRDFYLCHFLLDPHYNCYLIDLHRAAIRTTVPKRWRIKDLAGLYFSSKDIGLTKRDYWRFMRFYTGEELRYTLQHADKLWRMVQQRGDKLYLKHENQNS